MGPVLGRFVSSICDKKRMTPNLEFSPGTVKLLLRHCQAIIFLLIQAQTQVQGHEVGTRYFLGKVLEKFTISYEWDFVKQFKPVGYMHDCQPEKIIPCLYGPGSKKGKTKIEILQLPSGKQGEQKK